MNETRTYIIARHTVRLNAAGRFPASLPASFDPFVSDSRAPADLDVTFADTPATVSPQATVVDDTVSDMGRVCLLRDGQSWIVRLTDRTGAVHTLSADLLFSRALLHAEASSPDAPAAVSSLLRIAFSQRIITCGGLSVHASAVVTPDGSGYLFLGPSGTGKSTHSRLWTEAVTGTRLLNDDNPIITVGPDGSRILVHGSPWSGKTPCYTDSCAPLRGIARLRKSDDNRFTALHDVEAFAAILPSCSTIRSHAPLHDRMCDTVAALATAVPTALMLCRPDRDAAITSSGEFRKTEKTNKYPHIPTK